LLGGMYNPFLFFKNMYVTRKWGSLMTSHFFSYTPPPIGRISMVVFPSFFFCNLAD
jgi:hypothetical protein